MVHEVAQTVYFSIVEVIVVVVCAALAHLVVEVASDPVGRELSEIEEFWRLVVEEFVAPPDDLALLVDDVAQVV